MAASSGSSLSVIRINATARSLCSVQHAHFFKKHYITCLRDVWLADLAVGSAAPFLPAVSVPGWTTMAGKIDAGSQTTMPRLCMVLGWIPVHHVLDLCFRPRATAPYRACFNTVTFASRLRSAQSHSAKQNNLCVILETSLMSKNVTSPMPRV